jgi:hypothetical protein
LNEVPNNQLFKIGKKGIASMIQEQRWVRVLLWLGVWVALMLMVCV